MKQTQTNSDGQPVELEEARRQERIERYCDSICEPVELDGFTPSDERLALAACIGTLFVVAALIVGGVWAIIAMVGGA